MICPYICNIVQKTKYVYNEETVHVDTVLAEEKVPMECKKNECGAWFGMKCNYNQGSNG